MELYGIMIVKVHLESMDEAVDTMAIKRQEEKDNASSLDILALSGGPRFDLDRAALREDREQELVYE